MIFFLNKKYIALLLFRSLMISEAWGGGQSVKFYYEVSVSKTGEGSVYVSETSVSFSNPTSTGSVSVSYDPDEGEPEPEKGTKTFYFSASETNEDYFFKNWTDSNNKVISSSANFSKSLTITSKDENNPTKFNYIANFKEKGSLRVKANGNGFVSISKQDNVIGDRVTIEAKPHIFKSKFIGWKKNNEEEYCSTSNPLTLTVTGSEIYTAYFEENVNDGLYCRVKTTANNYLTVLGNQFIIVWSTQYQGEYPFTGAVFLNSLMCVPSSSKGVYSHPANILYVTGVDDKSLGLDEVVIKGQGITTQEMLNEAGYGNYKLSVKKSGDYYLGKSNIMGTDRFITDGASWNYQTIATTPYRSACFSSQKTYSNLIIEPLDENNIDTYYFGAEPEESNSYTNSLGKTKYYTTMYAAFPFRCYDGVKAYIVDDIIGSAVHCKEIEAGEVPSETPVILECETTNPRTNRLLPLFTTQSTILGQNLLKSQIDLDNNTVPNYDEAYSLDFRLPFDDTKMRVFGAEGIGPKFSTTNTEETYITSNTAYLDYSGSATELQLLFDIESKTGCFRLKNKDGGYLSVADNGELAVVTDANQIGTVLSMSLTPSSDQTYYSATKLSAQGKDFSDILGGSVKVGNINANLDIVSLYTENGNTKNFVETDGTVGTIEAEWTLVPVEEPLTLSATKVTYDKSTAEEKYVTTLYTDFPYSVGDGFSAFVVPEASEKNGVVLTDIGADVPANTGVVIAKSPASDDTGSFCIMPVYGADVDLESNLLKGTCLPVAYDPNTMYVLGRDNAGVVGFRTYTGTTVTANKAYLEMSEAGVKTNFMRFNFEEDDTPTAIIILETDKVESDGAWYTVTGIRLSGTPKSKGLYIHNGKKIMIK